MNEQAPSAEALKIAQDRVAELEHEVRALTRRLDTLGAQRLATPSDPTAGRHAGRVIVGAVAALVISILVSAIYMRGQLRNARTNAPTPTNATARP